MIVLDINAFPSVFNSNDKDYAEFCHVLRWVVKQRYACFIYGGTKYKQELKKMKEYHKLLNEFKKSGRCVEINSELIDNNANQLKIICNDAAFNDEHIVAIVNISGCKLVCTKDKEAMFYIKKKEFYNDQKIPQIYSGARNRDLLSNAYIVELKNKC